MKLKYLLTVGAALCSLFAAVPQTVAQGTAFTYQGRLNAAGAPANGSYDLQFTIYDGTNFPGNAVSGPVTNLATDVINGLFTTTLDFGPSAFNGSARWLEIAVRTNGGTVFTTLSPRQPLTSAPYAILAGDVANANIARLNLTSTTTPAAGVPQIINGFVVGATVTSGGSGYITPPSVTLENVGSGSGAVITANISGGQVVSLTVLNAGSGYSPATTLKIGDPPSNAYQVFAGANYFTGINLLNNPGNSFAGSFTGNGAGLTNVPGAISWQPVAGAAVQATGNTGYLLTNTQIVTVTLPPSPRIGDIVRVSGGVGGWRISQNVGQHILIDAFGRSNFTAVASSADGTKLVAVSDGDRIYTSTNSGAIWTPTSAPTNYWSCVASSSDGNRLVAAVHNSSYGAAGGPIYTSADAGVTWTATSAPDDYYWYAVASSADGSRLVAAGSGHSSGPTIYVSSDAGATWTPTSAPSSYWVSVASSSDGSKLVAADYGLIYISANSGATWALTSSPTNQWRSVASSSDGTKLAAATSYGLIYISANSGTTWTATSAPTNTWASVACSSDGSKLVAAAYENPYVSNSGLIYKSTDSGTTWTPISAPSSYWTSVACSSDGSKFVAVGNSIYNSQSSAQTATTSYLTGGPSAVIELQYVGNGLFRPLSYVGSLSAY